MDKMALGLIETVGLAAALEAADAAVKSANVMLAGYELTKGGGLVTIKLEGDVGAVNAAVQAGCAAAEKLSRVYGRKVIPRPHDELRPMIRSAETRKCGSAAAANAAEEAGAEGQAVSKELTKPQEGEGLKEPAVPHVEKTEPTCNLCNDIKCTREKGELKTNCIHYFDNLKED